MTVKKSSKKSSKKTLSRKSDPSETLLLIFVHDTENKGMYITAPSIEHIAHALGCCDTSNAHEAYLTVIASIKSKSVSPLSRQATVPLINHPAFKEAQRVLSLAKQPSVAEGASSEAPIS